MVGGLKIIPVKAGHEREFESTFADLRRAMRDKEPDCLLYALRKSRTNPRSYTVHEPYPDQAALEIHESSPRGRIYFPTIRAILENIAVEYFDGVVA
jgi:quinol monooxygenase YgiN